MSLNPPLSTPSFDVTGRNFVITGGTQGLGLAIARQLKQLGAANLILVSRSSEIGQTISRELSDDKCHVAHLPADLSQAEEASSVISRAVSLLRSSNDNGDSSNTISGVVNAAAVTHRGNLFTTTSSSFDLQFAINVRAPFLVTQSAAQHMIETSTTNGSIVNICSVASYGGAPFIMAYSAAKAALANLTKNNAAELAPKGIRVNGVNMGWCLTDNEHKLQKKQNGGDEGWVEKADGGVPLGRILRPMDVAVTVCFLLSDAARMTTGSVMELHPEFPHGMISLLDEDAR